MRVLLTGGYVGCEAQTYAARQLLYIGEHKAGLEQLADSVNAGFHHARWLDADPWFESVRTDPAFAAIATQARRESEVSREAFVAAGGNELLARHAV